jgi:hypothetical protein
MLLKGFFLNHFYAVDASLSSKTYELYPRCLSIHKIKRYKVQLC